MPEPALQLVRSFLAPPRLSPWARRVLQAADVREHWSGDRRIVHVAWLPSDLAAELYAGLMVSVWRPGHHWCDFEGIIHNVGILDWYVSAHSAHEVPLSLGREDLVGLRLSAAALTCECERQAWREFYGLAWPLARAGDALEDVAALCPRAVPALGGRGDIRVLHAETGRMLAVPRATTVAEAFERAGMLAPKVLLAGDQSVDKLRSALHRPFLWPDDRIDGLSCGVAYHSGVELCFRRYSLSAAARRVLRFVGSRRGAFLPVLGEADVSELADELKLQVDRGMIQVQPYCVEVVQFGPAGQPRSYCSLPVVPTSPTRRGLSNRPLGDRGVFWDDAPERLYIKAGETVSAAMARRGGKPPLFVYEAEGGATSASLTGALLARVLEDWSAPLPPGQLRAVDSGVLIRSAAGETLLRVPLLATVTAAELLQCVGREALGLRADGRPVAAVRSLELGGQRLLPTQLLRPEGLLELTVA